MKRVNDTPEEAKIREEIKAKGLDGKISPKMVLKIPRSAIEPFIAEGQLDYEIADAFGVSIAPIAALRKFYDLPLASDVKKMLEHIKPEPEVEVDGDDVLYNGTPIIDTKTMKANTVIYDEMTEHIISSGQRVEPIVFGKKEPLTASCEIKGYGLNAERIYPMQEEQTFDPPLLQIKTAGELAAPLVNGIAKYLDKLGIDVVEVEVRVRRIG